MYTVCVCIYIYISIVKIPFCNQEIITCNNHMPTCNQKDISLLTSNPYFLFLFSTNSLVFQPNPIVLFFCCLFCWFLKTVSVFLFTSNNYYFEPLYLFGFPFLAFFASPPPSSCFFFFLLYSPLCLSSRTVFALSPADRQRWQRPRTLHGAASAGGPRPAPGPDAVHQEGASVPLQRLQKCMAVVVVGCSYKTNKKNKSRPDTTSFQLCTAVCYWCWQ